MTSQRRAEAGRRVSLSSTLDKVDLDDSKSCAAGRDVASNETQFQKQPRSNSVLNLKENVPCLCNDDCSPSQVKTTLPLLKILRVRKARADKRRECDELVSEGRVPSAALKMVYDLAEGGHRTTDNTPIRRSSQSDGRTACPVPSLRAASADVDATTPVTSKTLWLPRSRGKGPLSELNNSEWRRMPHTLASLASSAKPEVPATGADKGDVGESDLYEEPGSKRFLQPISRIHKKRLLKRWGADLLSKQVSLGEEESVRPALWLLAKKEQGTEATVVHASASTTKEIARLQRLLSDAENTLREIQEQLYQTESRLATELCRLNMLHASLDQAQELRYQSLMEVFNENYRTLGLVEAQFEHVLSTSFNSRHTTLVDGTARIGWVAVDVLCVGLAVVVRLLARVRAYFRPADIHRLQERGVNEHG